MRCGSYTRFSSDSQHPASIDDQRLACARYAAQQGWQLLDEHQYVDEALSGVGVDHRPGYRRVLAALTSPPPFEVWLAVERSRLSRGVTEVHWSASVLQG